MRKAVLSLFAFTFLLNGASPGIRPRADAKSYPAYRERGDFAIGVFLVPREQVKKMFKPDLGSEGYVVIEVGVFPGPGKDVDLYPSDFMLAIGDKSAALRPVSADTIAEVVGAKKGTAKPA